ncbi:dihydrolipoyl dehydrogenase, partial [Pseudoalteromonas ruthenica]
HNCIPSIASTAPEMAWGGGTEKEAKEHGQNIETAVFPLAASGRAIASSRTEGQTKLIFDKDKERLIGGALLGLNAGEVLGEIRVGVESGAEPEALALPRHAPPTLNQASGLGGD